MARSVATVSARFIEDQSCPQFPQIVCSVQRSKFEESGKTRRRAAIFGFNVGLEVIVGIGFNLSSSGKSEPNGRGRVILFGELQIDTFRLLIIWASNHIVSTSQVAALPTE